MKYFKNNMEKKTIKNKNKESKTIQIKEKNIKKIEETKDEY